MIVKKIKNTKAEKPKVWQIGDLVDYIRYPHNRNPQEKIEYAGGRGFSFSDPYRSENGNDCPCAGVRAQQYAGTALDVFLAGK